MMLHEASLEHHWRPRVAARKGSAPVHAEGSEFTLLLSICAKALAASADHSLALSIDRGIDWQVFYDLADSHHLIPLIQPVIQSLPSGTVPEAIDQLMRQHMRANATRVLFLTAHLAQLAEHFDRKRLDWIAFKGPMLAMQAYPSLVRRQCGDLDILIRPRDVRAARAILIDAGHEMMFPNCSKRESDFLRSMDEPAENNYIRHACEYHLWRPIDALNIDLHWRINPPELCMELDESTMFDRAQPLRLAGRDVMQLDPADTLLMLCCNGAKDCWTRLDRICDVAGLLRSHPRADWRIALDAAARVGARRVLLLGIELARRLLEAPVPRWLANEVVREPSIRPLVPIIRRALVEPLDMPEMQWQLQTVLFHLRVRERATDRIRYCAARLCPTVGDWTAMKLPPRWAFLYYLLRPARLAARACAIPFGMGN